MDFDQITTEDLFRIGGSKWSRMGDALGAFIAEMDFGLAEPIKARLHESIDLGQSGYLTPRWTQDLQTSTTDFLSGRYGWSVSPDQVHAIPDVLAGMVITMNRHISPDARVIVPTPAYMPFMTLPGAYGHELVQVPMIRAEGEWLVDFDALDAAFGEGDLLVLCNPHNPIGKVYTADELATISEIVERHHGRVFNDEIHAPLTLNGARHIPYPTVSDAAANHSITALSASKAWNLAGYKCAQLVITDGTTLQPTDLHEPATPGVLANIAAYSDGEPWLAEVITYLEGNQRLIQEMLPTVLPGVEFIPNQGTYLAWLDCTALDLPTSPAKFFLDKANVAVTDGALCGEGGRGSVRLNFATPRPVLAEMLTRMGASAQEQLA